MRSMEDVHICSMSVRACAFMHVCVIGVGVNEQNVCMLYSLYERICLLVGGVYAHLLCMYVCMYVFP